MEGWRGAMEHLMNSGGGIRGHPDEEVMQVDTGEGSLTGALLDLMMVKKARVRLGVIGVEVKKSGFAGRMRAESMKKMLMLDGSRHTWNVKIRSVKNTR